jgi:flagellar biosynthesis GTPase FlhF
MKQKMDFVTNSSSTNWMLIASVIPAVSAVIGWTNATIQADLYDNEAIPESGNGDILSGPEAANWMHANGMLNDNNQLTEVFWAWYDQPISSEGSGNPLMGIVGEFSPDQRNDVLNFENMAIIVRDPQTDQAQNNSVKQDNNTNQTQATDSEAAVSEGQKNITENNTSQEQEEEENEQGPEDLPIDEPDEARKNQQEEGRHQEETPHPVEQPQPPEVTDNMQEQEPEPDISDCADWENRANAAIADNVKEPDKIKPVHQTIYLDITDSEKNYGLELQNGTVHISEGAPENESIKLSMSQEILDNLLNGKYKTVDDFISLLNPVNLVTFEYGADITVSIADKESLVKDLDMILDAFQVKREIRLAVHQGLHFL